MIDSLPLFKFVAFTLVFFIYVIMFSSSAKCFVYATSQTPLIPHDITEKTNWIYKNKI